MLDVLMFNVMLMLLLMLMINLRLFQAGPEVGS